LVHAPFILEDPDYKGLELDMIVFYEKQDMASERLIAFEGKDTWRRFLACDNCGLAEWVDQQCSPTMHNALLKLWEMVEDSKSARVIDNLESDLTIHHLTVEKNTLDANYDKSELVADMKGEMAKKDADQQKLNDKDLLLVNLTRAQAT
ncbi:hypothetical protein ZWY2020_005373, partial [Hordeum vulgare]